MKPHLGLLYFALMASALLSSCVSISLTPEVQKSKGLNFQSPGSSFREIKLPPADQAWKSSATGNTISYFSECSNNIVTLESVRDDVMSTLPKAQLIASNEVQHDGRDGLLSLIEGNLEGIPMRMSLLVYQKNGCRYSLSLTGRKDQFDQDLPTFTNFEKGFKAP